MNIYLASTSPRRAELLRQAGIPFTVIEPEVSEEIAWQNDPVDMVVKLAQKKALAVMHRLQSGIVLAADTIVKCEGLLLGKPADEDDARRMLNLLCGRPHAVFTGLAIFDCVSGRCETGAAKTKVWMKPLEPDQIDRYVKSGEPLDKAGAYGIQGKGALLIERIDGCYFNVVGLPLSLLHEMLIRMQVPTWLNGKDGGNGK